MITQSRAIQCLYIIQTMAGWEETDNDEYKQALSDLTKYLFKDNVKGLMCIHDVSTPSNPHDYLMDINEDDPKFTFRGGGQV